MYYGANIVIHHGQFNNSLPDSNLSTKKYLDKLHSLHDLDLFSLNCKQSFDFLSSNRIRCNYYSPIALKNFKTQNSVIISDE